MELLDRLLRLLLLSKPNERKASRASRFAILWDVNVHYLTNLTEELTKLLIRGGEVEVPYEYLT